MIKTLALPKLIHLLTSLPNVEQALFNDLNKLFFNLTWDGKPVKIKRNTLITDFEDGGLKMIHLQQFNAYLKISLVKKISSNWKGGWEKIMAKKIKYYGGERICSLQKEKIREISKIFSNPFWKDVFYSLYLAKPLVKLNIKECLSLDLLNFVSIDDFPFYMRWEKAGVTNINHIMDTVTQNFLTFEKIKTLIKNNNFIQYYTITSNIPTDIKKCLKDNIDNINTENFHPKDDFLYRLINRQSLKFVYITLLKTLTHLPIQTFLKWEEILGIDIAD